MHLVYIDDSRDERLCVFSALAVPEDTWRESLQSIRQFRRRMKAEYGILVYKEFHAWKLVSGRGSISDRVVTKSQRCAIFRGFLCEVAGLPNVKLFNACFPAGRDERAFERLLNRINRTLDAWASRAILFCDRGKESVYTRLVRRMAVFNPIPSRYGAWSETGGQFRNIPIERILEDPVFKQSEQSYFIQAVDCIAYALLRRENQLPSKNRYGLHECFSLMSDILVREASTRDPEGVIRP